MTGLSIPTLVRALWLAENWSKNCICMRQWSGKGNDGISVDNDDWALAYQRASRRAGRIGKALFDKLGMTGDPDHEAFMNWFGLTWDSIHCTGPDWERDKARGE